MKQFKGFTLIEVIMVMVILSILAIVAAPRFLKLQDTAYKQVQKNMVAAVNSTLSLGAVKAAVEGKVNASIEIDQMQVCFHGGYPAVDNKASSCQGASDVYNLLALMDYDDLKDRTVSCSADSTFPAGYDCPGKSVTTSKPEDAPKAMGGKGSALFIAIADNCLVAIKKVDKSPKPEVKPLGNCSS